MSSHDSYYRAMTVERDHALTFAVAGGEGVKPGGCAPTSSSSSPKRGDDTSSMRKNSPRAVIINEPTVAECEESIASYYGEARAKKRRAAVDPFGNEASKRVKCLEPISQKATQISTTHEIPDLHGVLPSRLASSFEDYQASPLGFGVRGDWHTAYNAACSAVSSLSGVVITASPGQGSIQCVFDRDVFFLVLVKQLGRSDAENLDVHQMVEVVVQSEENERVEWPLTVDTLMAHPSIANLCPTKLSPMVA